MDIEDIICLYGDEFVKDIEKTFEYYINNELFNDINNVVNTYQSSVMRQWEFPYKYVAMKQLLRVSESFNEIISIITRYSLRYRYDVIEEDDVTPVLLEFMA